MEASTEKIVKVSMPAMTTAQYLKFWNGPFSMSDKEINTLAALIESDGNLCSRENRLSTADTMDSSVTIINTYIKRLRDRKALIKNGKEYSLAKLLGRRKAITISFNTRT